jgi:hypothetical protein
MDQEQLKAIRYMIRVAPVGEMKDVLLNIKSIVGSEEGFIQSADIISTLRKWYETHR